MPITLVSTPALAPALPALLREFERISGHTVAVTYATAGALAGNLQASGIDVAASTKSTIEQLQVEGRVLPCSRRDIARVGLGVQIRKGAEKPVIGTVQAFRCAILAAASIGYIDPSGGAAAGTHAARLMKQLGIADAVAAKTRLVGGTALSGAVAEGELELGLAPISEIVSDPRVELVGPVPAELQEVTVLSAAVTTSSTAPGDAQGLVDFLAGPASAAELVARALR